MHGMVLNELKAFVDAHLGEGGWRAVTETARLGGRIYLPVQEYPDAEAVALVGAAAQLTGTPAGDLLEAFGEFIVPGLLKMYGSLLKRDWGALDIIEHAEATVHRVIRLREGGPRPPYLRCQRNSADEITIFYDSPRRMCRLALGMLRGIGKQCRETLAAAETTCMQKGAPQCTIVVRAVTAPSQPPPSARSG